MSFVHLTPSERAWLTVRSYLVEHRYDLAVAAAEDYPPDRRMADTPLLAAPRWLPPAPIPLRDIGLELTDTDPKTPAEAELEVPPPLLPWRADGTRYRRYSEAMGELAAPLVFENRATYRLTGADLASRAPRLVFAAGPQDGPGLLPAALAGPGQGGPRRRPLSGHPGRRIPAVGRGALEPAA
jgi:hypothetical protein